MATTGLTTREAVLARLERMKNKDVPEDGEGESLISAEEKKLDATESQQKKSKIPKQPTEKLDGDEDDEGDMSDIDIDDEAAENAENDRLMINEEVPSPPPLDEKEIAFLADAAEIERLSAGGDMNMQDEYGLTALQRACMKGHSALVEIIILLGADVNKSTANGGTPLDIAIRGGHEDIAQVLFRNGAVRNADDIRECDFDRGCQIS